MTRSRREIEALADILLGEVPDGGEHAKVVTDRVVLLVEAHLPVRGVLWRLAAATLIASDEPSTLLELDDRQVHATRLDANVDESPATTLEHVIGQAEAGHTWLVAASGPSPWTGECRSVDEVVLLTGADQAAVVGAYRAAKQIISEVGKPDLKLGVVIAGSPQSIAEDVWGRLSETIETHLGVQPTLIGTLPQLDVAGPHGRITVPLQGARLGILIDSIRARASSADQGGKRAPATPPRPSLLLQSPQQVSVDPAPSVDPPEPTVPSGPAGDAAQLQPSDGGKTSCSGTRRGSGPLPSGLSLLIVDAPTPPGVRLAIDSAGALHILAQECDAASLESARRWASNHLGLLAAASPPLDASQAIVCDVLVSNIHRAASLAGGPWQVHFVQGDLCFAVPDPEP